MCAAPPIVGAWSMAVLLWQLFEYYYLLRHHACMQSQNSHLITYASICGILINTQYGSTVYIGIAMVFVFSPYIREIQFLLSVSSQFDF